LTGAQSRQSRSQTPGRVATQPGRRGSRLSVMRSWVLAVTAIVLLASCAGSPTGHAGGVSPSAASSPGPSSVARLAGQPHAQPRLCTAPDMTASFHYEGAGTMHSYGAISVTNVSDTPCWVDREVTLRTFGSLPSPRLVSIPYRISRGHVLIRAGATAWTPTDTVADNLLRQRSCGTARRVTIWIAGVHSALTVSPPSLTDKSRIVLHLCHVGMKTEPLRPAGGILVRSWN
jgi:hypothetical protein